MSLFLHITGINSRLYPALALPRYESRAHVIPTPLMPPQLFWFLSVPAAPNESTAWDVLRTTLIDTSSAYHLHFPDFKIGTLDNLLLVSDDLQRQDQLTEAIVAKLVDSLRT